MIPAVIPSPAGDCFAMYEPGLGPVVLMCPPFGDEALKTARVWRKLALNLGQHGIASLRVDLPGTGNSAGEATDPDRVESWRAAIRACAAWLVPRHDRRIILFGHRFGALLALDAVASGVEAERLVLLDPPASGRAQARLLGARARFADDGVLPEGADYIQAGGVPVSKSTLDAIAAMPALLRGTALPPSLLVLPGSSPWPDRLRAHGGTVDTLLFDGHADFVPHDIFRATAPVTVLNGVTDYLVRACGSSIQSVPSPPPTMSEMTFRGFTETAIRFGADRQLFGILCRPKLTASGPAVILPTTGADPCSGMSRLWTDLARRLARAGVTSLRFDMRGTGESESASDTSLITMVYATDRVDDLRAAIDALGEHGYGSVRVIGYCAGAYAAWHAAVHDTRITGILVGNLLYLSQLTTLTDELLKLRPGDSQIGLSGTTPMNSVALRVAKVVRLLDNGARSVVPRRLRLMLRRWAPGPTRTRRHLAALVARGCAVKLVMSHDDHGHVRLRQAYGEQPVLPSGVSLAVIDGADHEFSNRHHRARFLDLAASFALEGRTVWPALTASPQRAEVLENA